MSTTAAKLEDAQKAIKAGAIAACISLGMTAIFMAISLSSVDAGLGPALDGGWVLLIDLALMAALAFFMFRKSRIAATIMFLYFLASKAIQLIAGEYSGIIMGGVFLYFYGRAVWGAFTWHSLKDAHDAASVFGDPEPRASADGRLFK